ncbi:MAG: hypothetical protein IKJ79_07365 [Bacteroidaceae bacterium]|nr:hypothetical protein [Bacteroidaceae bacterium]
MKILNTILYILLSLTITISAQNIEVCDSLLQQAIKASDEKDYFHSLELLSKAKEIAEQKNAYEQQFWIYTNIGINYAELTDYRTSLDHFSKAYQIATQRLDKRFELSVINNIAGVYILDKKFDKALEQSLLAYKSALDSGDSLFVGGCAMNIANISLSLNKLDKTAEYISIAEKMFVNTPNDSLELQIIKANYLCKMGKHEEAYQKALQILNEAIETEQSAIETAALLVLTQTMLDIKDYNSAIRYSQQALKQAITIEERKNIYDTLAEAYYRTHRYHQAFAYKDSALQVTDSIRNIQEEQHFENANTQIELLRRENELEEYRLRTRTSYIVLGMGILATIILAWALINQIIKNRQEKEISQINIEREKQQQQLLQKQLEEQRTKALLEEERYKHEIELRDKELMSKAMIVANRNDIVTNIVNELSKSQYFKETNNSALKHTVTQLQRVIDNNEAWQDFSTYFEQRNDAFIAALRDKHPELTANEIRFLSLIYINLSTKEIASLLNITPEYCKKKRQQLARKIGFENSKALFSYLCTLA